ncbi:hypothetical protein NPIL_535331 [Nephila pilipes]|uniref:Uncharacterized protein n=1 Tax=Nephila pilipes TaxID=299642 RepID=A0A8X6PIY1_NEPPI|nr:hypothetical protein NPIL_535331 [Nephila pilipes]
MIMIVDDSVVLKIVNLGLLIQIPMTLHDMCNQTVRRWSVYKALHFLHVITTYVYHFLSNDGRAPQTFCTSTPDHVPKLLPYSMDNLFPTIEMEPFHVDEDIIVSPTYIM